MRPGQAAPVFARSNSRSMSAISSFNEAGAGCPGIQSFLEDMKERPKGFNEAGAGCPGIL